MNASISPQWQRLAKTVGSIGINLVPLFGVLFFDWSILILMLLFWFENVVIGVMNVLKMLLAEHGNKMKWLAKLFLVPFFCLHYGGFCAAHWVFVVSIFGGDGQTTYLLGQTDWSTLVPMSEPLLWVALAGIVAVQLMVTLIDYVGSGEWRTAKAEELLMKPYGRIIVLQVTLIIGGSLALLSGGAVYALLILIALKIAMELGLVVFGDRKQPSPVATRHSLERAA